MSSSPSEFKLPRGRKKFRNIQIGQSDYLSTLQAADTHGSTDAPKCARQRGPFRTQEHLVQLALEMDLPCFLKARALVRLRVFSYCGCGHTRLDRRLAQGVRCARAALVSHGVPRAESVAKRLVVKKSPTYMSDLATPHSRHPWWHAISSLFRNSKGAWYTRLHPSSTK